MRHFEHGSSLVTAPEGHEFFVDAAPDREGKHPEDLRIAQALCGFAFDAGREIEAAFRRTIAYVGLGAPIGGFEGQDSLEREIEAYKSTSPGWDNEREWP